ncbi:MAG: prepilin-type N-terminal cleavage/methylation domain-containing protein [Lentisphaerae bacterium]|nr:prepilin-type N-terminal cleavage/methylation domain-containing protein [Lentisphaerota bacterium]
MKSSEKNVSFSLTNSGFTLVEVMVASLILTFILGGILYGAIQASKLQFAAGNVYTASVLARNRIENCKVYAYSSLSMMNETNTQLDQFGVTNVNGMFWRSTTVITNAPVNPYCTEIIVNVVYETQPGVTSSVPVTVSSLIDA